MRQSKTKNYLKKTKNYNGLNTFWRAEQITPSGVPILTASEFIPKSVFQFGRARISTVEQENLTNCACHFFTDDYRFAVVWNRPQKMVKQLSGFSVVMSPDLTLSFDFPDLVNRWNHYRKMWVSCWWRSQGLEVIPVANWLDEASYSWCFEGMPINSVIAISANEVSESYELDLFVQGFKEMERLLRPKHIIMIGGKKQLPKVQSNTCCPIVYFNPRWS